MELTLPDVHENVEKFQNKCVSEKCGDAVRWCFQRTCLYTEVLIVEAVVIQTHSQPNVSIRVYTCEGNLVTEAMRSQKTEDVFEAEVFIAA